MLCARCDGERYVLGPTNCFIGSCTVRLNTRTHNTVSVMPLPPVYSMESEFDPVELLGTMIPPFVDPFRFDESDFRAESPAPSSMNLNRSSFLKLRASLTSESTLASLAAASYPRFQSPEPYQGPFVVQPAAAYPRFQDLEPYQEPSVVQVQPATAYPRFQDSEPFLGSSVVQLAAINLSAQREVPTVVPERGRLTPDQAIYIFMQKETKSSRTAALLAAKYGVTPKAIRDIWSHRTWAHNTRPHWTYG